MKSIFWLLSFVTLYSFGAPNSDSVLYVVNPPAFQEKLINETRATVGYDFSNPYVNVISAGIGYYYLILPLVAVGFEVTGYHGEKRPTTKDMELKMKEYGYKVHFHSPQWSSNIGLRILPFSGLLNLLNSKYVMAEVAIVLRGGVLEYSELGMSPLMGAGLEFNFGFNSTWGVNTALIYSASQPKDRPWESWVGFRLGPVVRF